MKKKSSVKKRSDNKHNCKDRGENISLISQELEKRFPGECGLSQVFPKVVIFSQVFPGSIGTMN